MNAYERAGGKPDALQMPRIASAVISANHVLAVTTVEGVDIRADELENGVRAVIDVAPGAHIEYPVHLCFGMLPEEGRQEIFSEFRIGDGAEVGFLAHCTFPNARNLTHEMNARVLVGRGATMRYCETHYHGESGGITVLPTTQASVAEGGRLEVEFSLVHGRVGCLDVRIDVEVAARGVVEMATKAYGLGDDEINVSEVMRLNGEGSRGLTRTRVAVRDRAESAVHTTAEGNAPGAVGHMDCTEIVRGAAVARNTPVVVVRDDQARVTHEAAIGSVGKTELETLMARGLAEEDAVDIIVRGMLR